MNKHLFMIFGLLGATLPVEAQKEDRKDLGTETVTVTKAYAPTISDAYKIVPVPDLNDSIVLKKRQIEYPIFSVPVASTFTPAKGKPSTVKKMPPPKRFDSYAMAGGGNPANLLAKFYTGKAIDRESSYTVGLDHFSSVGDIDGTVLDTKFADTRLQGAYTKRDRDLDWGVDVSARHRTNPWYGLPPETFETADLDGIDARQHYFLVGAGATLDIADSYLENARVGYHRFWDAAKSGENRLMFEPVFEFPIQGETLTVGLKVDFVNGDFENAPLNFAANEFGIAYSNLQVGINPKIDLVHDELSLEIGANLVYGRDGERGEGTFYVYPTVTASYPLLETVAVAYGGIEGELVQNTYEGFVSDNPFVSPTLNIVPTDRQYNGYLGLRGQLLPNLGYDLKGSYRAENRRPLFLLNPRNTARDDDKGYTYGNSFDVFYDDIRILGIFGELNVEFDRTFTMRINAEYAHYTTETDRPAWNLPEVTANLFLDYQIGEKWHLGGNLFFTGERQDVATLATPSGVFSEFPATLLTLDRFFDANLQIGYRWNEQLSVFLNGANLAGNNYQRWANFPVQGFQLLAGATYKFDL